MQSTLDREIYSRTQDTSYLQAAETDVCLVEVYQLSKYYHTYTITVKVVPYE